MAAELAEGSDELCAFCYDAGRLEIYSRRLDTLCSYPAYLLELLKVAGL